MDVKLPAIVLEDFEIPEAHAGGVENEVTGSINYAFIGSGQGGGRIAEQFYHLGYKKTLIVNTSAQDLSRVSVPDEQKMLLRKGGKDDALGGAGKNMALGEEAVVKFQQDIYDTLKKLFGTKVDHIMVCVSAGGGSGGGSAIPLEMICKRYLKYCGHTTDLQSRVGFIATLPTVGEAASIKVATNSYELSDALSSEAERGSISPLLIVDNDRINKLYRGLTMQQFYPTINKSIAELFHIFNVLSIQDSEYISFDPTDYRTIIACGGHCIMGVTVVKDLSGETSISQAIKNNLDKTLLASGFDLTSAKCAASIVVGGKEMFGSVGGLREAIDYGFDALASMTGGTVHRGIYEDDVERLRVYTIIGGLKRPKDRYNELRTLAGSQYP